MQKKIFFLFILLLVSSSFSFADSTTSSNVVPPFTTPIRPEVQVITPRLPDRSNPYATIPACPANPVCPDINGNPPPGKILDCPQFCIDVRDAPQISQNPNRYAYVKNAVCPSGYSASHVYKVGQEIIWDDKPTIVRPPITQAQYNVMKSSGYQCSQSNISGTERYYDYEPWYMTCPGCDACSCVDSKDDPNKYRTNIRGVGDVMVQVIAKKKYSTGMVWIAEYTWVKIQCEPPAGWYETANQVPTALICTRVQSVWEK